jgi:pilus assembly protein CpaF
VTRLQDGSRKISHITEVLGFEPNTGTYQIQDIFVRHYMGTGPKGEILSELVPTGIEPRFMEQLREHDATLPPAVMEAIEHRKATSPPRG